MDAAALGRRLPHRQRHVDLLGGEPCCDRHVAAVPPCGRSSASVTRFFRPLMAGPLDLAFFRRSWSPASSAVRRPSPSCRAPRRAPPRSPVRRRPRRSRPSREFSSVSRVLMIAFTILTLLVDDDFAADLRSRPTTQPKEKPAPALPARVSQIRFPKAWEGAGLRQQRFQKHSGWCSSDIPARPWPWRPARRTPAARGSPCRTAPCGRSRCRPC